MIELKDHSLLKTQAFVAGSWIAGSGTFSVDNPATCETLAEVACADAEVCEDAIAAANQAFTQWRRRSAKERAQILRRWFELILENKADLARILTAEQGKPLAESNAEIDYGASFVEWFSEQAKRLNGDILPGASASGRILVTREPVGVCAAITPWNFPVAMVTRKVAPALAAGCTVVLKPAEQTPLCALALAELAQRAGVPAGVFNVLPADSEQSIAIGKVLCGSNVVRKLTFTGSTAVGKILMQQSAPTVKKLSLELGGHAPFIVFDDADLDEAVEGAMQSKYRNAGQACIGANRIYVQRGVLDAFVEKFAARVNALQTGNGLEQGVAIGPLIDDGAVAKVREHVEDAQAKGAKIVAGGQAHALGGRFYQPTVLRDVSPDMICMREETFGPLAPIMSFETEEEVLALANHEEYGLAAYFFTRDMDRLFRISEALEFGMVGVNTGLISNEIAPFGGIKQSGLGREGSIYGLDDFTEMKYLCLKVKGTPAP